MSILHVENTSSSSYKPSRQRAVLFPGSELLMELRTLSRNGIALAHIHKDVYRESFESRGDSHVLRLAGLMAAK